MSQSTPMQRLGRHLAGMVIIFFLGFGVFWPELRWRIFASTASATVTGVAISSGGVDYRFTAFDATVRSGSDWDIDVLKMPKVGSTLEVQYFPAIKGESRAASSAQDGPLVFAGIVGVLMVIGAILVIGDLRAIRRARTQPAAPALA